MQALPVAPYLQTEERADREDLLIQAERTIEYDSSTDDREGKSD